jgi:energy-coupling factor transport system ATP-binding protein
MSRTAVSVDGYSYRHPESEQLTLAEVSFEAREGELILLAGASGSGKSTLIRSIAGLAPAFDGGTAAGSITVCGLDTRDHGAADIARVCGTVLQDPERQVVMTTVRAELALPLESRGQTSGEVARGVEEAALMLGIEGILDRRLQNLSGGELQRVSIAAALAVRPSLLLLDEPASQLDPVAADDLIWTLRRLNEEQGITVIISEQRMEKVLAAVDRVLVLEEGCIVGDNPPHEHLAAADRCGWPAPPVAVIHKGSGMVGPPPVSVKELRSRLREEGIVPTQPPFGVPDAEPETPVRKGLLRRFKKEHVDPAVEVKGLWDERDAGKTILAGIDLKVGAGEVVALMGRNGAGKSTLLRQIAGLEDPSRGQARARGRVAWLSQTPASFLTGEVLADSLSEEDLAEADLGSLAQRNPRDLSGGETQRAALAIVLAGDERPGVVLLDEPTRGMDQASSERLASVIKDLSDGGAAVIVATHDPELAAKVASRTVLMGEGTVIADDSTRAVLTGGWHYATETARAIGIQGGPITPIEGAATVAAWFAEREEAEQ